LNKRGGGVYFNIRGEKSVIQASLRRGECNLHLLAKISSPALKLGLINSSSTSTRISPIYKHMDINISSILGL